MKVLYYKPANAAKAIDSQFTALPEKSSSMQCHHCFHEMDCFRTALLQESCDIVLVAASGAEGMEAIIAAKEILPDVPRVWLSDDCNFALQAYRLNCAYFGTMSANAEHLNRVLQKLEREQGAIACI